MARGRMLNRSISKDMEVAGLVAEVGGLGGMFYTWLIAWLDRNGRAHAEPRILKGEVAPLIDSITPDLIAATIECAERLGLVETYDVGGTTYLCYPKFEKNQVGLRKDREPDSGIPDPPQSSGTVPEVIRQAAGKDPPEEEEKGSGREVEEEGKAPRAESAPPPAAARKDRHGIATVPLGSSSSGSDGVWKAGDPLTVPTHFAALLESVGGPMAGEGRSQVLSNKVRIEELLPVAPAEYGPVIAGLQVKGKALSVGLLAKALADTRRDGARSFGGRVERNSQAPPRDVPGGGSRVPSAEESRRRLADIESEAMSDDSKRVVAEALAKLGDRPGEAPV